MTNSALTDQISILVVDAKYPPDHTGSGLRIHRTYSRIRKQFPVKIYVLTLQNQENSKDFEIYEGVEIYRIKPSRSVVAQFISVGKFFLNNRKLSIDIVHAVGASILVITASICAKLLSKKLIREKTVTLDENSIGVTAKIKRFLNYPRYYHWLKYSYRCADLLIAINSVIKDYYIKLGINEKIIWNRPNPVDINIFKPSENNKRNILRENLGLPNNKIVCLTIGKFEPRKNQNFLVEIAKKLNEKYIFILAGPVSNQYKGYYAELQDSIHKNDLNQRFYIYSGHHKDIVKFIQASNILLVPSTSEGTPNVMLEALCCGLPVVVNENLHLQEYIMNGVNGYNALLNPDNFVQSIEMAEDLSLEYTNSNYIAHTARKSYGSNMLDKEHLKHLISLNHY